MREYSQAEALSFTEVTRNELTHWTDKRIIVAEVAEAGGRGKHRRFSFDNLVQIRVAHELSAFRMAGVRLWESMFAVKLALKSGAPLIRFQSNGATFVVGPSMAFDVDRDVAVLVVNVQKIAADLARKTGEVPPALTPTQEDLDRAARSAKKRLDRGRARR